MEKKILITGSNGFLGKNLVLHFQKNFENQYDILCPKRKQLDLLDDLSVYDYLKTNNVDMVIHCAVQSTLGMSEECKLLELENNLKMFFNLERCSRFYGKMYYFGSGAEYSKSAYTPKMKEEYFGSSVPDDKYGLSKYIMSKCTKSNPKVYDLRLFGVFGPYENYNYRFISNAVCKVLRGLDIVIRQNIYFDYMYIGDLCTIMEWFVENTPKEKYYNVCTGTKVDILSVAMAIREKLNSHVNIQVGNDGLGVEYTGDNSRLLDEIGDIKFTTIDKALDEMIDDEAILHYKNMPKGAQFFPDAITVTEDERTDLKLYQCKYCGLIQIMGEPVPYFKDVIRAAGISEEMKEYRRKYFQAFIDKYNLFDKKIIEIGAGCGEFLSVMNEIGVYGYGLEHLSESVETCREKGLNVFQGFIENRTTKIQQAPYDGFFIMNFLEHIPNPTEFLKGIFNNLKDEGIGLIEVPNVDMILEKLLFSEFIGDHLMYFTNESIRTLLNNNGFEIVSCEEVWHDYVLAVVVRKKRKINLTPFYNQLDKISTQMNKFVAEYKAEGKSIAVWGAGHQALALLSLTNIYKSVDVVIDSAPFKQNKYTPGTNIKVVAPTYLYENSIDMILVIAASYSDEVVGIISEKFPNIEIAVFREDGLGIVKSNKYMRINDEKNESNNETGDFKSNSKLL